MAKNYFKEFRSYGNKAGNPISGQDIGPSYLIGLSQSEHSICFILPTCGANHSLLLLETIVHVVTYQQYDLGSFKFGNDLYNAKTSGMS